MVKDKDMQFFMENLKLKRKRKKKIDLPDRGFEPRIFSNFPALYLNFRAMRLHLLSLLKKIRLYLPAAQTAQKQKTHTLKSP